MPAPSRSPRSSRSRRPSEVSAGGVVVRPFGTGGRAGWEVALIRVGDRWSLPKGLVEAGENPATAALREVAEECGIPLAALTLRDPLPGSDYVYRRDSRLVFKHVDHFLIEVPAATPLRHQADEVDEAEWMSFEAALSRASFADTAAALRRARELLAGG